MISRIGINYNKEKYTLPKTKTFDRPVLGHANNLTFTHSFNDYKLMTTFSFKGLSEIARRKTKYPQDHLYRTELAKNIGCKTDALMSVLGEQEFKDILLTLSPLDYNIGCKFGNVNRGLVRANLHIHTIDSDGTMTVESLLDQAVRYADRMKNPPFIFSITNHDVVCDTKNALEIIAQNPDRYKDIRFVPGIELTTQYNNPEILSEPVSVDVLSYCINPFDETLNRFLSINKDDNIAYARTIAAKTAKLGLKFDFDKLLNENRYVEINGNLYILRKYLLKQAKEEGISNRIIHQLFSDHIKKYGSILISRSTPTIEEVGSKLKTGMLTMAHPGRYGFYDPSDPSTKRPLPERINKYKLNDGISPKQALKVFLTDFKNTCGEAVEANYQYGSRYPDLGSNPWLAAIEDEVNALGFIKTGGLDTHGKSLFHYN